LAILHQTGSFHAKQCVSSTERLLSIRNAADPCRKPPIRCQRMRQKAHDMSGRAPPAVVAQQRGAYARPMNLSSLDRWIAGFDGALRTVAGSHHAARHSPADALEPDAAGGLTDDERRLSGALMRVNHVGEVCAQALYAAQALATRDPALATRLDAAAREETDHLAWTEQRLRDLGARPSLLNPLWYAGAFGIGLAAGRLGGDATSLGFVVETERQVERHLQGHLERLPAADKASRAVVAQMKADESRHAQDALDAGARILPAPARWAMRLAARVMTTTAHRI
jgi:3-demethoxyubiquinol 3-hydroxylase